MFLINTYIYINLYKYINIFNHINTFNNLKHTTYQSKKMKKYFVKLMNIVNLVNLEKRKIIPIFQNKFPPCKTCRYHAENTNICTIFNRQSIEARKNEFWCGKEAEFYREKKIYK